MSSKKAKELTFLKTTLVHKQSIPMADKPLPRLACEGLSSIAGVT